MEDLQQKEARRLGELIGYAFRGLLLILMGSFMVALYATDGYILPDKARAYVFEAKPHVEKKNLHERTKPRWMKEMEAKKENQ